MSKHWNTHRSVFSDTPRTLYRAVGLDALGRAQEETTGIAAAVALIAHNVLPHLDLGNETGIWTGLVERSEAIVEPKINEEWQDSGEIATLDVSAVPKPEKISKVERKQLQAKIEAAVGPQNKGGEALPNPNPQWSNSAPAWSYDFAPRATAAVADAVDATAEAIMTARSKTDKALIDVLMNLIKQQTVAASQSWKTLDRRLRLLWWREALYSTRARTGYRALEAPAAAAQMAIDVFYEVPIYYPPSVEHFLREAVVAVVGEEKGRGRGENS